MRRETYVLAAFSIHHRKALQRFSGELPEKGGEEDGGPSEGS